MPSQQTNLGSETRRDAVGLRLDLAVALAEGTTRDALTAVGAQTNAFPEREAARSPTASTWSVPGLLRRCWRAFQERRQRERLRVSLRDLSDRELMDIGLTQGDIDYIDAHRAVERLREDTTYFWLSRGVM